MDAADMNLAPVPPTYQYDPDPCQYAGGSLLSITALVIVGVLALSLLHVLGSLRRRSSDKLLHAIVLGAYTLSYSLVSYTLGLMQDSECFFYEFPVWAVCLLMLLGGTDSLMACDLNDVNNWKSFYIKHVIKGVLVVYIFLHFGLVPEYKRALWAILVVNILQSYVRIKSMRMASKSHLLWKNVKPIVDYMKRETVASGQRRSNPVTMEGYRYVVTGEHQLKTYGKQAIAMGLSSGDRKQVADDTKIITTVEQIWQCKGRLLRSRRGLRLKDICLSMALSKMLNRRFAGFELAEANLQKTNDFVFQGLLVGDQPYERAFRVIEVELGFVYDMYYTRYPYLYQKGRHLALCLPVVMVLLCSWLTRELFNRHKKPDNKGNIPLSTTLFLMAVVTVLEAFQLYLHVASGWFKAEMIKSYVASPALQRGGCFSHAMLSILLSFKTLGSWEDKLGQYSLLHNYDGTRRTSSCLHYVTLCLVDKAKKGHRRGKLVKLSKEVKQAVIESLVECNGRLTNGVRSLRSNGVHDKLSWACRGKVTHTILVWHIATTICKHKLDVSLPKNSTRSSSKQLPEALSKEDNTAIIMISKVASGLSQYCAYLVAFAPDLLPGHSFDSVSMLDESIKEACELDLPQGGNSKAMEKKCDMLMSISDANHDDARIVIQGARLARQLTEEIQDMKLQWKVLSDLWAEMILYVAPCDDAQARAHLEALARGGEFITHLWALLTHAGVLERDHAGPMAAV